MTRLDGVDEARKRMARSRERRLKIQGGIALAAIMAGAVGGMPAVYFSHIFGSGLAPIAGGIALWLTIVVGSALIACAIQVAYYTAVDKWGCHQDD